MKSNNYVHVEVLTDSYVHLYTVAMPYRDARQFTYIDGYYTFASIDAVLSIRGSFIVWTHPERLQDTFQCDGTLDYNERRVSHPNEYVD